MDDETNRSASEHSDRQRRAAKTADLYPALAAVTIRRARPEDACLQANQSLGILQINSAHNFPLFPSPEERRLVDKLFSHPRLLRGSGSGWLT